MAVDLSSIDLKTERSACRPFTIHPLSARYPPPSPPPVNHLPPLCFSYLHTHHLIICVFSPPALGLGKVIFSAPAQAPIQLYISMARSTSSRQAVCTDHQNRGVWTYNTPAAGVWPTGLQLLLPTHLQKRGGVRTNGSLSVLRRYHQSHYHHPRCVFRFSCFLLGAAAPAAAAAADAPGYVDQISACRNW